MKVSETELFYPLNRYFSSLGYIVNTEVENKYGYKRADILLTLAPETAEAKGLNPKTIIGIECKTSLSFELLDQADYWKDYTDLNYVCVPTINKERPKVVQKFIDFLGIGLIEIDLKRYHKFYDEFKDKPYYIIKNDNGYPDLYKLGLNFRANPKPNNPNVKAKANLASVIYEEHQTWALGGQRATSTYVSGYKLLMKDVYSYLRNKRNLGTDDGWASAREIWSYLEDHSSDLVRKHYKNPVPSISSALQKYEDGDVESIHGAKSIVFRLMPNSTKYLDMDKLHPTEAKIKASEQLEDDD